MSHQAVAPRIPGPALNPHLDWAGLEEAYFAQDPGILSIDDFLSPPSLKAVRRFCLESTMWFDAKARYLGAYHVDGFSTPLLWQNGEELAQRMPRVFKDYELTTWCVAAPSPLHTVCSIRHIHCARRQVGIQIWLLRRGDSYPCGCGGSECKLVDNTLGGES